MTSYESPGPLRRIGTALGGALKRAILGKSSHDYMKQFTGSDEYWDRAIAAQLGWPQKPPGKPEPNPDCEPVPMWTKPRVRGEVENLPIDVGRNKRPPVRRDLHTVER